MILKIAYKPNSQHQIKFHASKARERLLMTGFGGGKTLAGAAEHTKLALLNPKSESLIISANIPIARKTIVPTLKSLWNNSNIDYNFNSATFIFHLPRVNHTIYIASGEIPDSLKGSNVTHVWFDELATMNQDAYTQGIARARQKCRTGNKIFHTTTPEGLNWVYEEFFMTQRPDREIITGTSYDNSALPKEYLKSLSDRFTPEQQELYLHGRFAKSREGLIIPEWDDIWQYDRLEDPHYNFYEHIVALDLGVRDKTAILFGTYYFTKSILAIESEVIFQGNEMNTLLIADAIRKEEARLWGESTNIFRFSDWNNPLLLQDLSYLHGISVVNAQKDQLEAMVNDLRVFTKAGRLRIHESCKELLGVINLAKWNHRKIRPDFQRSKAYGHADALSALLIMKRNLNEYANPIPGEIYNPFISHARIIELNKHPLEEIFG